MCAVQEIILNIDIAPTLVDLAGVPDGSAVITDGQSFKSLLTSNMSAEPPSQWRTQFLVEHDGEFQDVIKGCPDLSNQNVAVSLALWVLNSNCVNFLHTSLYCCRIRPEGLSCDTEHDLSATAKFLVFTCMVVMHFQLSGTACHHHCNKSLALHYLSINWKLFLFQRAFMLTIFHFICIFILFLSISFWHICNILFKLFIFSSYWFC